MCAFSAKGILLLPTYGFIRQLPGYKYFTATRLYQASHFSQLEYICLNLQLTRHSLARRLVLPRLESLFLRVPSCPFAVSSLIHCVSWGSSTAFTISPECIHSNAPCHSPNA